MTVVAITPSPVAGQTDTIEAQCDMCNRTATWVHRDDMIGHLYWLQNPGWHWRKSERGDYAVVSCPDCWLGRGMRRDFETGGVW